MFSARVGGICDSRVWIWESLNCPKIYAISAACQVSPSITNSWSLFKLMSIESVMPSNHLNLCHPLFLLPSIFSSIRVFSKESVLHIRWPKYWSFSFSISSFNEYSGLISFRIDWSPCSPRDSQESFPTPQFKSINSLMFSFLYGPILISIYNYWNESMTLLFIPVLNLLMILTSRTPLKWQPLKAIPSAKMYL